MSQTLESQAIDQRPAPRHPGDRPKPSVRLIQAKAQCHAMIPQTSAPQTRATMNTHAACLGLSALTLAFLSGPVQASTWQICHLELRIVEVLKQPYPQLQAQIVKARPKSSSVECPAQGSLLTFTPETPDYQATLPAGNGPGKDSRYRSTTVTWMASVKATATRMRVVSSTTRWWADNQAAGERGI